MGSCSVTVRRAHCRFSDLLLRPTIASSGFVPTTDTRLFAMEATVTKLARQVSFYEAPSHAVRHH